ncbi:carboxypeptidase regulatory-like domain-containing protein [Tunturiibacter empetritectus]|uniref:TonB-dependent transporter Oar-like beta-barrel domain-containing protein n=1 Tax=Tunturiibacter lichenicola TaxID=2051959 RepID=A0A852VJP4_9BACT|nr:carboxypeptidase-like regulatory domain-containing protein [Edaphobacter lichenicola]NYF91391.1 hypothetical protein [Edaphobacter lichenicola]
MKLLACLLLSALWFVPTAVFSQSTSATISGGVTDPTGRFITGAAVEIANDETGVRYSDQTNTSGMYFVPILPPGHYHVQVSKQGFKTIIKPDVVLNVQGAIALNFVLPVGATSQSITVEAGSSLLNTADASVSTVIDRKFVANIPLNGRSFQDLISMTPGIVTQSPQSSQAVGASGDFSVNGQRTESNYYTVDGVSANVGAGAATGGPQAATSGGIGATTALGTTQSLVSVDALQEFRVSGSTYSAEYGRSPGAQFSLLTRSGTKKFHGSAFDYLRNNYFDANNWFNDHYGRAITPLRQNDFGGTLGGPIHLPYLGPPSHPSYFFASYEGLRLTQPQASSIQYVPDAAMRQNAPPAMKSILNAFPLPSIGGIDYASGLAQFIEPFSLPSKIDSISGRIDHVVSPKSSVFFRFSDTPSSTSTRVLSALTQTSFDTQTYTVGATSRLSNRFTNEFRLGYSCSDSRTQTALDSFGGATSVDLGSALGNEASETAGSAFQLSFFGTGTSILQAIGSVNQSRQWNIVDTAGLSLGKHQLKLGIDYRRIKSPLYPSSPYVSGIYLDQSSVLNNSADIGILSKVLPATPIFNETAVFLQDEWHSLPRLTISGGIRWEIDPPPTEEHGNDAFTLLGDLADPSSLTVAPRGTPLWKTSWYNFAPRLGAAWTARDQPDWETILRTGAGVFFDSGNQIATTGYQYLGFSAIQIGTGQAFPVTPAQLAFSPSTTAPYTSTAVVAFPPHLQLPYTLQWNVSLQQALGRPQALTVSYVGSNGRRLLQMQQLSLTALNPNFSTVDVVQTGTTSNYQALQIQFQRTVTHGIQALASYTWSHSLDFGSNNASLPLTRGNSDFDVRDNLQGGVSWELPGEYQRKSAEAILGGWALDGRLIARTAFPVTLGGDLLTDSATGSRYYSNVDLIATQPVYLYGSQYPGGRSINQAAFQLPAAEKTGNAPRNFVRGFDASQINLAARRTFPLAGSATVQFRAEAFNLLNHPMFGLIDSTLSDATFGQATQTLNQSLATLGSQYQQGGPRSLQFALKIQF